MRDVKPFQGISIITTKVDDEEVEHLLGLEEGMWLMCPDCGGCRFKVDALIKAELEVVSGEVTLIADADYSEVLVNRVRECAHCHFKGEFVPIHKEEVKE